jgi:hypothetical protein
LRARLRHHPPGLIPLYIYRQSHPLNLALLAVWTATLSVGIGLVCATYPSVVVLQALLLTAAITLALTGYTFWATHNGKEFDFLGPWLFSTLVALVVVSLLAMFFPLGSGAQLAMAFIGAVLFSACALLQRSPPPLPSLTHAPPPPCARRRHRVRYVRDHQACAPARASPQHPKPQNTLLTRVFMSRPLALPSFPPRHRLLRGRVCVG